jgi:hypothetical protein
MYEYAWVILSGDTPISKENLNAKEAWPFAVEILQDQGQGYMDFAVIGRSWTGVLDLPDPRKEPLNYQLCTWCQGEGVEIWGSGEVHLCPVCHGNGQELKPVEDWKHPPKDIQLVRNIDLTDVLLPFYVFYRNGQAMSKMAFVPEKDITEEMMPEWVGELEDLLEKYHDGYVIVVAFHS